MRKRSEVMSFSREDLERIVKYLAKAEIVGSLFIGEFFEQQVHWSDNGNCKVVTDYQEGSWKDLK